MWGCAFKIPLSRQKRTARRWFGSISGTDSGWKKLWASSSVNAGYQLRFFHKADVLSLLRELGLGLCLGSITFWWRFASMQVLHSFPYHSLVVLTDLEWYRNEIPLSAWCLLWSTSRVALRSLFENVPRFLNAFPGTCTFNLSAQFSGMWVGILRPFSRFSVPMTRQRADISWREKFWIAEISHALKVSGTDISSRKTNVPTVCRGKKPNTQYAKKYNTSVSTCYI